MIFSNLTRETKVSYANVYIYCAIKIILIAYAYKMHLIISSVRYLL